MAEQATTALENEEEEEPKRRLTWSELEEYVLDWYVRGVESLDPERSVMGPLRYTKLAADVMVFRRLWSATQILKRGWFHCYEDTVAVPKSGSEAHLTMRNTIEIRTPCSAGLIVLHLRRGFQLSPHEVANFPANRLPPHLIN